MRALLVATLLASACIDLDAFSSRYDASVGDLSLVDQAMLGGDADALGDLEPLTTCVLVEAQQAAFTVDPVTTAAPAIALTRILGVDEFLIGVAAEDAKIHFARYGTQGLSLLDATLDCNGSPCVGVRIAKSDGAASVNFVAAIRGTGATLNAYTPATDTVGAVQLLSCSGTDPSGDGDVGTDDTNAVLAAPCNGEMLRTINQTGMQEAANFFPTETRVVRTPSSLFLLYTVVGNGLSIAPLGLPTPTVESPTSLSAGTLSNFGADARNDDEILYAGLDVTGTFVFTRYAIAENMQTPIVPSGSAALMPSAPVSVAASASRYIVVFDGASGMTASVIDAGGATQTSYPLSSNDGLHPQIAFDPASGAFAVVYLDDGGHIPTVARLLCP